MNIYYKILRFVTDITADPVSQPEDDKPEKKNVKIDTEHFARISQSKQITKLGFVTTD